MRGNARAHRFTVFDVMEAQGLFDANPANSSSPDFRGPQQFPKMFYHPNGNTRVTQKAEILSTPMGPKLVGEQTEIITRAAADPEEEEALRAAGWHDHPAHAIAAAGGTMPPMVERNRTRDLQKQIEALQIQLAAAQKASVSPPPKEEEELAAVKGPKVA